MKKIEQIAALLLKKGISFEYEPKFLKVTDPNILFEVFAYACYHIETGKLVLGTHDHKSMPIEMAVELIKIYKKK